MGVLKLASDLNFNIVSEAMCLDVYSIGITVLLDIFLSECILKFKLFLLLNNKQC